MSAVKSEYWRSADDMVVAAEDNRFLRTLFYRAMTPIYRLSPITSLRILHLLKFGKLPNIKSPQTIQEKAQWLKLYYRHPLYPICADKYTVRSYVKDCGLGDILNPLLWHGDRAEDIPFDELPDSFVLKVTHGSGYSIIVRDKKVLDRKVAMRKINGWLKEKYLECFGEWFYNVQKPCIICEGLIDGEAPGEVPIDYKVYCYNGKARFIQCDIGRFTSSRKRVIYDLDWQRTEFMINYYGGHTEVAKPVQFDNMLLYAEKLSAPFPYSRIDFFVRDDELVFGEITLVSSGGFEPITPESYSYVLGSWLDLPDPLAYDEGASYAFAGGV